MWQRPQTGACRSCSCIRRRSRWAKRDVAVRWVERLRNPPSALPLECPDGLRYRSTCLRRVSSVGRRLLRPMPAAGLGTFVRNSPATFDRLALRGRSTSETRTRRRWPRHGWRSPCTTPVDAPQHAVVQVDCDRRCDARRSRALQFPNVLGLRLHSRKPPEMVGCAWSEAVEM
jgi:hypothetical protein